MKILYLSCHSILEYDEVKLLHELGHEVFSPGAYFDPSAPPDKMRPGIEELEYDPKIVDAYNKIGAQHPGKDGKEHLTKEFLDLFDTIIVMHVPKWLTMNWHVLKGRRVIWRTIGQSVTQVEAHLKGIRNDLQIVRYSPKEQTIPGYIGSDTTIRFYKDPNDFGPWNGEKERVVTFAQDMKARGSSCNFTFFESATRPFERHLFGPRNENTGDWCTGKVPYERLLQEMRDNRVYFYTGTHPASYTLNFMEAWMTGIPIVAIGPKHGNSMHFPGHDLYEIPDLIQNGVNGFISDDSTELQSYIKKLLEDKDFATNIGQAGRKSAIEHFDKDKIKKQWKDFLDA